MSQTTLCPYPEGPALGNTFVKHNVTCVNRENVVITDRLTAIFDVIQVPEQCEQSLLTVLGRNGVGRERSVKVVVM